MNNEGLPATLLGIERYATIMQLSLPHFNQMAGPKAPLKSGCDDVWDQEARVALAETIQQAEELIANELGFWPAPKFITSERHLFGLTGIRQDWRNAELKTKFGYVEAYGTERLTLLQANATVLYSDHDNDPLDREELATIGGLIYEDLSACANPCDVAVFFRVADGAIDAGDDRFEIKPIRVDIDGSTMTIKAESSLFIRPELWDLTKNDCFGSDDPNQWRYNFDVGNLVTAVDVYCRTVNPQSPVTLLWDGRCYCTSSPCNHQTQTACAYETDLERGFFVPRPSTWNGTSNADTAPMLFTPPEAVRVNYRAGYPLDPKTCRMNSNLERAIVKLTNALLPEPPCGYCDAAELRWRNDRKNIDPLTPEAASLPWDLYTQGALEAWRIVKKMAMGRGGKMGRQ